MNYRILGRTGLKVSALGFGCMRLPMDGGKVNDKLAIPLLRRAVELGVNYFDSATFYGHGDSQRAVGDALHDLRDEVILSTKNPVTDPKRIDEWKRNFETSLRLMRTDYLDIYNVHGLNWEAYKRGFRGEGSLLETFLDAKRQGLIRHICFSFHDTPENLIKIIDEDIFESVTLQYNLLDRANESGIRYMAERNVGVVVMGPVAGGRLANQAIEGQPGAATSAALAMKFVLSNPGVTIALSGMGDMAMLEENVAIASESLELSSAEAAEADRTQTAQKGLMELYCTSCGYCLPCPAGVEIPQNFTLAQLDQVYNLGPLAKKQYAALGGRARFCLDCGQCLEKCPQKLDIPRHMRKVVERLDADMLRPAIEAGITSVAQAENGLRFDFILKPVNLTDHKVRGQLRLQAAGIEVLNRRVVIDTGKHKAIEVQQVIEPELTDGPIAYSATFQAAGVEAACQGKYKALFAHRLAPGAAIAPNQVVIQAPECNAMGDKDLAKTHRMRFRIAHVEDAFVIAAEVDDDLIGPADGGPEVEKDCLHLLLDCRPEDQLRRGNYADSCVRVRIVPGLNGAVGRFETVKGGGLDFTPASIRASEREGGYAVDARIPLACLRLTPGQRVFGFNLGQCSAAANGKSDMMMFWSGGWANNNSTEQFGLVFLE